MCQLCLRHLPFDSLVCHGAKENSSADYMKETQHLKQQLISESKAKKKKKKRWIFRNNDSLQTSHYYFITALVLPLLSS